jgi:hypothetical protein
MMTFKEYLIETNIMSDDALKQAMRDYDKRSMGKSDGSKPSTKRLDQMDKRKARKAGEEEEETKRGRPKTPEFIKRQSDAGREVKPKRGRQKIPAMLRRQAR